jgi:hypothetical protein
MRPILQTRLRAEPRFERGGIARGGRKRVDLNLFPLGNQVSGNWVQAIVNALKYQ